MISRSVRTPLDKLLRTIRKERKFLPTDETEYRWIVEFQPDLMKPNNSDIDPDVLDLMFGLEVVR